MSTQHTTVTPHPVETTLARGLIGITQIVPYYFHF